jgi:exodeoxyribonuclease VII large subunit
MTGAVIERNENALSSAAAALDAFSPLAVLGRGYALCRDADGAAVRTAASLSRGDLLSVRFKDGSADTVVEGVSLDAQN